MQPAGGHSWPITFVIGPTMDTLDTLIDFVVRTPAVLIYIGMGIWGILYSRFAKRMSFEGDIPTDWKKRKTYKATPKMRLYGVCLSALPLVCGLYYITRALLRK